MKIRLLEILALDKSDSEKVDLIMAEFNSSAPIEERREAFIENLKPYVEVYGKDMVTEFFRYWSAKSARGRLMAFEKERSWNLASRLNRWKENSKRFRIVNLLKQK